MQPLSKRYMPTLPVFALLLFWTGHLWAAGDHGYEPGGSGGVEPPSTPLDSALRRRLNARRLGTIADRYRVRGTLWRIVRSRYRGFRGFRRLRLRGAGPIMQNPEMTIENSIAQMRFPSQETRGHTYEQDISFDAAIGDRIQTGLTLASTRYRISGPDGIDMETQGADAFATFQIQGPLSLGLFVTGAQVDVEEINGNGSILGGGATASLSYEIKNTALSGTATLSRLFQDTGEQDCATIAAGLAAVETHWTERFSTSVFTFVSHTHNAPEDIDKTFWSAGMDLTVTPRESLAITVGYERTIDMDDYREGRLTLSLLLAW